MLSVLHVGKYYPPVPGGMERVVQMLCAATRGRLHNQVLTFNRGRTTVREVVDDVPVTRVGTLAAAGSVPLATGFPRELRRCRADVMIFHEPNPSALLSLLLARPSMPYAVWFHSDVIRPWLQYRLFYDPIARPIYNGARSFVVSSPDLADSSPVLQRFRERISVIPFAIDADRWQLSSQLAGTAETLRKKDPRPIVLFVGRLVPYKGVEVLLDATAGLPVRVVIAGDGPSRTSLEARAGANGRRAEFIGPVPDEELKAWMHAAAVLVLPSVTRAEAFGFVQLEAMACGVPVVSTSLATGVPWVNQHGVTGLVVPPGDAGALRAALGRLLADPSLRTRLGQAGRHRVRTVFDVPSMTERIVQLCEQVARS